MAALLNEARKMRWKVRRDYEVVVGKSRHKTGEIFEATIDQVAGFTRMLDKLPDIPSALCPSPKEEPVIDPATIKLEEVEVEPIVMTRPIKRGRPARPFNRVMRAE
jgi:hypothetical protein